MSENIDQDVLFGALRCDEQRRNFAATMEDSRGNRFRVAIDWIGLDPEEALEKAREIYALVIPCEPEYRQAAASLLLDLYNNDWRDGEAIDAAAFIQRISLSSMKIAPLEAGEPCCVTLYYLDGGLFAGHYIQVFLDADFGFGNAQLAG